MKSPSLLFLLRSAAGRAFLLKWSRLLALRLRALIARLGLRLSILALLPLSALALAPVGVGVSWAYHAFSGHPSFIETRMLEVSKLDSAEIDATLSELASDRWRSLLSSSQLEQLSASWASLREAGSGRSWIADDGELFRLQARLAWLDALRALNPNDSPSDRLAARAMLDRIERMEGRLMLARSTQRIDEPSFFWALNPASFVGLSGSDTPADALARSWKARIEASALGFFALLGFISGMALLAAGIWLLGHLAARSLRSLRLHLDQSRSDGFLFDWSRAAELSDLEREARHGAPGRSTRL